MSTLKRERIQLRPAVADENCIRVRLDRRTIVLIKNMKKLEYWKLRYPDAHLVDAGGHPLPAAVDAEAPSGA